MNNEENIYVVLEKSLTVFGRLARLVDDYEYTHITLCMNDDFEDFVSFSRNRHYAPFDSGFSHETLDCYAYGNNKSVQLKVFKIPVSHQQKEKINQLIDRVEKDKDNYIFNLYSAITMNIFHGIRIYKTYNCMSFVGKALELAGILKTDKKYYQLDIKEMDMMLTPYFFEERKFEKTKVLSSHYMDKVSIFYNIYSFLKLNVRLIYRLIFCR